MTDTNPLAPIEALADNWARGYPSLVIAPQLRAALAEARQAVDALVAEDARRDRIERIKDGMASRDPRRCCASIPTDCAEVTRLRERAEAAEAELAALGEVTVTEEHAVKHRDGWVAGPGASLDHMRALVAAHVSGADALVRRTVVTTRRVGEWEVAE